MIAFLFLVCIIIVGLIFLGALAKIYIYLFPLMPKTALAVLASSLSVFFLFSDVLLSVSLFSSLSCIIIYHYYAAIKKREAKNQP